MKNSILFTLFLLSSIFVFGQASKDINNYKYVIIPTKFDFLSEKNQYQMNALTKFLFEKKFTTFFDDDKLPMEIANNKCKALLVNLVNDSGMFVTTLKLEIKNCVGDFLFSFEGESREKSYEKAYQGAVRDAYRKFDAQVNYSYQPSSNTGKIDTITDEVFIEVPLVTTNVDKNLKKEEIIATTESTFETLYAQKMENGYQLINTKPEIVFSILKTNVENVYIIKDKNGILYKKNNNWVAEYLVNDELMTKTYQIKF